MVDETTTQQDTPTDVGGETKDAVNGIAGQVLGFLSNAFGKPENHKKLNGVLKHGDLIASLAGPKAALFVDITRSALNTDFGEIKKDGLKSEAGATLLGNATNTVTTQVGMKLARKYIKNPQLADLAGGMIGKLIGDQTNKILSKKFEVDILSPEQRVKAEAKAKAEAAEAKKAAEEKAKEEKMKADIEAEFEKKYGPLKTEEEQKTPEQAAKDAVDDYKAEQAKQAEEKTKASEEEPSNGYTVEVDGFDYVTDTSSVSLDEEKEAKEKERAKGEVRFNDAIEASQREELEVEKKNLTDKGENAMFAAAAAIKNTGLTAKMEDVDSISPANNSESMVDKLGFKKIEGTSIGLN